MRAVGRSSTLVAGALLLSGCWVDVGRPPGWGNGSVVDVNKAGVVALHAYGAGTEQSFTWSLSGGWTPIGALSQDGITAIDESGTAVGQARSLSGDGTPCAAIWPAGERGRCLASRSTGTQRDVALDLNEQGTVVGQSGGLPVAWIKTRKLRTLRLARPTDTWGRVEAINAHGVMVGTVGVSEFQGDGRAVRWDSPTSRPVELQADPGALDSLVFAISDNGVMVGLISDASGASRSVVWRPDGSVRELPDPSSVVTSVSDLDAPVGYVSGGQAAVFDPVTLVPTVVGPANRRSVATDAAGTYIAGWVEGPGGGLNVAVFGHPHFG